MRTLSFLAFCTSGMLTGCTTHYLHRQAEPLTTRQVEIISEPPGARIEVNDNYIGDAPITTTFRCSPDGRFVENTMIRALPTQPGDYYVQSKLFFGGFSSYSAFGNDSINTLNDTIPSRLYFDMRRAPVSRDINLSIP